MTFVIEMRMRTVTEEPHPGSTWLRAAVRLVACRARLVSSRCARATRTGRLYFGIPKPALVDNAKSLTPNFQLHFQSYFTNTFLFNVKKENKTEEK